MSKQEWCNAHDLLKDELGREPTEAEIIDYLSGAIDYYEED